MKTHTAYPIPDSTWVAFCSVYIPETEDVDDMLETTLLAVVDKNDKDLTHDMPEWVWERIEDDATDYVEELIEKGQAL